MVLGASGASVGGVVVTVTGWREAGQEAVCRGYCRPAGFPLRQDTVAGTRTLPAGDGIPGIFRAISTGAYALLAGQLSNEQANVTGNLLGRQRQPWGGSNSNRHAARAPKRHLATFTLQPGQTTRLRINFA